MSNYINRLKSYNSYSGCDMVATLQVSSHNGDLKNNIYTLGSLQTISISTHQDKRPVRSLSNINAKEYTMGQRTIAGSLVFAVFDKHFADQLFKDSIADINKTEIENPISTIMLPDELPPFDITISYANEYGHTSRMALYGVRLINEGQVMSINDIYTENTYQFVATALEPLNKDENIGQAHRSNSDSQIAPTSKVRTIDNDTLTTIVESFNNGGDFYSKEKVILSVDVENPHTLTDSGLARFNLSPEQKIGEIKISNTSNNEISSIIIEDYPASKTYCAQLDSGSYSAVFESSNAISNTVHFKVVHNFELLDNDNYAPIIEYVTDTSVCILSNNPNHDMATCITKDNETRSYRTIDDIAIKSKKAIFKNLNPNTTYMFSTYNSLETKASSYNAQAKTLKYSSELVDEFKNYIELNSIVFNADLNNAIDLIDNNISTITVHHNLIDFILSIKTEENALKDELLYFAVKFQNHINYDLNKFSTLKQPEKDLSNAFYNTIEVPEKAEHCNIFKTKNKKTIFEEKISNATSYEFLGMFNTRYCAYAIKDNARGPKYDFVCFNADAKNNLDEYTLSNELSKISNDSIHSLYSGISNTNLIRMSAEHLKKPNIAYLKKPMVNVNSDLSVDVSLNYTDVLSTEQYIIISFCEAKEALDHTPIKKVKIKFTDKINLSSFYTGIKIDKSYAIWIENTQGYIISQIESFNTYLHNDEIIIEDENIKNKQVQREVNNIQKKFEQKVKMTSELTELFESEKSNYETHESLVFNNLISNIILNKNTFYEYPTLINKLLEVKTDSDVFINNNFTVKCQYSKSKKTVKFVSDKKLKVSYSYINEVDGEVHSSTMSLKDNTLELKNHTGISVITCIADNMYSNTGYIIIDNKTGAFDSYKLTTEVI